MPNIPISGLPLTTSVCATALVPIVQNGVTCSTYACLLGSGGGGGVSCIVQGTGICISPSCGTGAVTICSTGGGGGVMAAGCGTGSIVGTGCGNNAIGNYSFSGGGSSNTACGNFSFVGGGSGNVVNGTCSFIGGGQGNLTCYCNSFIGGGQGNCVLACNSVISGGCGNTNSGYGSVIIGGYNNQVGNCFSVVLGGCQNAVGGFSIVGGFANINCATYSAVLSGCNNSTYGGFNFIGSGSGNYISQGVLSNIVGGGDNKIRGGANYSTISGGICNLLCNPNNTQFTSSISGGYCNTICGDNSFIGGGRFNTISCGNVYGSILGGRSNTISADYAGVFGCAINNTTACSFMSNRLVACNLFGAGAICADANGVIVPVSSDERLKTNICSLDCGINRVSLLNPVTYNWIDEKYGKGQQIGFIAQEVEKVVPEAVFKTSNDDYGFNDRPLVALLTKTIQEQELRITKLENLVENLIKK